MIGCVFHVVGASFDPGPALEGSTLQPYAVFQSGDLVHPGSKKFTKRHESGGFKCEVSASGRDLPQQVADAIAFLEAHHADLERLSVTSEVESMHLDFGHNLRIDGETCAAQFDRLPPRLLKLAGELGIGIELSLYPRRGDGPEPLQGDS